MLPRLCSGCWHHLVRYTFTLLDSKHGNEIAALALQRSSGVSVQWLKIGQGLISHFILNFLLEDAALQYCVRFYGPAKGIGGTCAYLPAPLDLLPFRSPRSTEESSLSYSRISLITCFTYRINLGLIPHLQSPISSHPAFSPWCPHICSLHLCLCFCFGTRFTCSISNFSF